MKKKSKCIVILSTKSAGSSALQQLMCNFAGAKHVEHTRHNEFETLYWTKAASLLRLPQIRLPDSEVPISRAAAERELGQFLRSNVDGIELPSDPRESVFSGWRALCRQYSPIFVEKSPHHLHQWSSLQLMMDAEIRLPDIEFRFVGLVRNPMDVLYSAWTRWRIRPEVFQHHWKMAYENLERFKSLVGDRLVIVRYEDLSAVPGTARNLLEKIVPNEYSDDADRFIHNRSVLKWKGDRQYGFQLDDESFSVAKRFDYSDDELTNTRKPGWRYKSVFERNAYKFVKKPASRVRRAIRKLV